MSDTFVLVLTALLALGVLGWTLWGIWQIARHTPTRQRALSHVLGSTAGTSLLGVVLPAVLMGALDPFPIWLVYAVLTVVAAAVLAWRWHARESGKGRQAIGRAFGAKSVNGSPGTGRQLHQLIPTTMS